MIYQLLYKKKRKQRWWRYLLLRSAYQNAQNGKRSDAELVGAFRKLGYATPEAPIIDCWNALVSLGAQMSPRLDREKVQLLGERINNVDARSLPVLAWLDLYRLGIGVGLFAIANTFRVKAIDCSIALTGRGKVIRADAVRCFYGNVERGNYDSAGQLLEKLREVGCSSQEIEQARWFLELFSGVALDSCPGLADQASPEDVHFGAYVLGNSLALVGPAPTEQGNGPEIDEHDIVVKFSYRGGDKGRDPATQGRRVDISYYNNTQATTLARNNYRDVLETIKWGVCINKKGIRQFPNGLGNLRQVNSLQWLLPDTHFNAGPNAVIDLLRFRPGAVNIFNTDLMLSAGRFAGYRPEGAKPIEYTRSFIKTHDPVLQYVTMHRLWELGYIAGDTRFESVMTMGLSGYLEKLQGVHGANEQALI